MGGHSQTAVGREGDVEDPGGIGEGVALFDGLLGGIDDGDIGFGRRAEFSGVGVDVGAIDAGAIGRTFEIAGAPAGGEAFGSKPARKVRVGAREAVSISEMESLQELAT